MFVENDGLTFASPQITWALGGGDSLKMDFLSRAKKMGAPEVTGITVRFTATTLDGVTATAKGADRGKLMFKRVIFKDDETMLDVSGNSLRVLEQIELGAKAVDPADIASAATSSSYQAFLRIMFEPIKAERPRDFRVPLVNFLEGGDFSFQFPDALPTGFGTVLGGKVQFYFHVVDGRTRELKSRRKISEVSFNRDDDSYVTDGAVRGHYLTSLLTTTGFTSLSGVSVINSTNLELPPDLPKGLLVERYRKHSQALNESTDEIVAGTVIPLVQPDRFQKTFSMPQFKSIHTKIGSTPTSAILLRDVVVGRPMRVSADQMGKADPGEYANALLKQGHVVTPKGTERHVSEFAADLVRIAPIRFK